MQLAYESQIQALFFCFLYKVQLSSIIYREQCGKALKNLKEEQEMNLKPFSLFFKCC